MRQAEGRLCFSNNLQLTEAFLLGMGGKTPVATLLVTFCCSLYGNIVCGRHSLSRVVLAWHEWEWIDTQRGLLCHE